MRWPQNWFCRAAGPHGRSTSGTASQPDSIGLYDVPVQRWRGVEATPGGWGRSVVTIGVFDGVHRGHRQIIGRAVDRAAQLGVQSVVVTFDPHPAEVVRPGSRPPVLTSPRRQAELIAELGVDGLCVLPFTAEFSRLEPAAFAHTVLVDGLHATEVVVGRNFRFGHGASGDVPALAELGSRFGFAVSGAELVAAGGTTFSSTYVRACVAAGDMRAAATALGRDHRLEGVVVRGDQRGRLLGFPTANVEPYPHAAVPADGVYAGRLVRGIGWAGAPKGEVAEASLPAAISVGTNPTFAGVERRVEAYVLDFDGDLYGEHAGVEFVSRIRAMERFDDIGDLVARMSLDVELTRELLGDSSR
jgi:riboflavin kinase/FMN adenylyltransferase